MAAYGRLDVYWPDGPIENFSLDKPVIAIGRSSGNDIVLDTNAVSRYHVSISLEGEKVLLRDLEAVNGTYVDGVRMEANATRLLKGGEEIQIGDVRLIYQPLNVDISTPPHPNPAEFDPVTPIAIDPVTFTVQTDATDQTVTPGAHNQTIIDVQNLTDQVTRYLVQIDGLPKEWVRLDRTEIELTPGSHSQVVLSFKPLRRSDSKPGDYPFKVHVESRTEPSHRVEVAGVLHLLSYGGFGIVLSTPRITAATPFEVYIHNQGNAPLVIHLSGVDPAHLFTFDIQPNNLTLNAGERRAIRGTLRPKRQRWTGASRDHRFDVIAQAKDASGFQAAVSGVYTEKSGLPAWLPVLLLPLIAGILLIGVIGGALLVLPAFRPTATVTATVIPPTLTATVFLTAPPTITLTSAPPTIPPTALPANAPTVPAPTVPPTVPAIVTPCSAGQVF